MTFEITSGETNDTRTVEIGKDDDNASIPIVPVFKGKPERGSTRDGSKDPNFNDIWSVRPLDHPGSSVGGPSPGPIYHNNNDDRDRERDRDRNRYGGGSGDDSWKQFPQYAIWTTERYNRKQQHDQPVYHHRGC